MRLLISIDDTDDIESKGTGEIAEEIASLLEIKQLGKASKVTRHQLFVHDDIPYTSHNSSMCFEFELLHTNQYDYMIELCEAHLKKEASIESDPGLCICKIDEIAKEALITFGQESKIMVKSKQDAYDLANEQAVFLNEYGGTGDGVIGALAGIGLRLSGNDGRFKGKHKLESGTYKVSELINLLDIDGIINHHTNEYLEDETIDIDGKLKSILLDHKQVLPVYKSQERYKNCLKEHLKIY